MHQPESWASDDLRDKEVSHCLVFQRITAVSSVALQDM